MDAGELRVFDLREFPGVPESGQCTCFMAFRVFSQQKRATDSHHLGRQSLPRPENPGQHGVRGRRNYLSSESSSDSDSEGHGIAVDSASEKADDDAARKGMRRRQRHHRNELY